MKNLDAWQAAALADTGRPVHRAGDRRWVRSAGGIYTVATANPATGELPVGRIIEADDFDDRDILAKDYTDETDGAVGGWAFGACQMVVVRVRWDASGGTDLDIRFTLRARGFSDADLTLGYAHANQIPNTGAWWLKWAGDNTSAEGVEAVAIRMDSLRAGLLPSADHIELDLSSYWWAAQSSGDFTIEIETFDTTDATQAGTDWTFPAAALLDSISFPAASETLYTAASYDGDPIGTIWLELIAKNGVFIPVA